MFEKDMILSEDQDLSTAAGDVDSTNEVDLGEGLKAGDGGQYVLELWISEAFASAGAATLQITVKDGTATGPTDTLLATKAFALAALTKSVGKPFLSIPLPGGEQGVRRFVELKYTIGDFTTTYGKMTAGIRARGC